MQTYGYTYALKPTIYEYYFSQFSFVCYKLNNSVTILFAVDFISCCRRHLRRRVDVVCCQLVSTVVRQHVSANKLSSCCMLACMHVHMYFFVFAVVLGCSLALMHRFAKQQMFVYFQLEYIRRICMCQRFLCVCTLLFSSICTIGRTAHVLRSRLFPLVCLPVRPVARPFGILFTFQCDLCTKYVCMYVCICICEHVYVLMCGFVFASILLSVLSVVIY